jgi:hypothetical protein
MATVVIAMVARVYMQDTAKPAKDWTKENSTGKTEEWDSEDMSASKLLDTSNDPDVLHGSTDQYDWSQTETEVEIFVKLDKVANLADLRAKQIRANITSTSLSVQVNGETLVKGEFPAKVLADDCTWQLEEPRNAPKRIWITLYKAVPTTRNQHWKSALKGDAEIDVAKLGPPVFGVDTNDPNRVQKFKDQVGSVYPVHSS